MEEKAKINSKVYIEKILQPMIASANVHFGDEKLWTFQQDGATAPYGEYHSELVQRKSSTVLVQGEMASLLPRPKPDGLFHMVSS